jgi:hypothetical protein
MRDLKNIFKELCDQISNLEVNESEIIFSNGNLPTVPDAIKTSDIYIKKGAHYYGSFRADLLNVFAHEKTYICLGLLILSVIFDRKPRVVTLKIDHKHSDIKFFKIKNNSRNVDDLALGLNSIPHAFLYIPERADKHPFAYTGLTVRDLPCFSLTNEADCLITENDWQSRDTVEGCGSDEGSAYFAELLLNFGLCSNQMLEINLEGECGFRGVSRGSSEISLFLPGHLAWTENHWK